MDRFVELNMVELLSIINDSFFTNFDDICNTLEKITGIMIGTDEYREALFYSKYYFLWKYPFLKEVSERKVNNYNIDKLINKLTKKYGKTLILRQLPLEITERIGIDKRIKYY